jgi:hypothetical protein
MIAMFCQQNAPDRRLDGRTVYVIVAATATASVFMRFRAASISPRRSAANSLAAEPSLLAASRQAFS